MKFSFLPLFPAIFEGIAVSSAAGLTKGQRIYEKTLRMGATKIEVLSEWYKKDALGTTSPRISKTGVITIVATNGPLFPKSLIARAVASAVQAIIAKLLPTRTIDRRKCGVAIRSSSIRALNDPSLALFRTLSLLQETTAVSEPEKKADMKIVTTIIDTENSTFSP